MPWPAIIAVGVGVELPLVSPTTAEVVCVIVDVASAWPPAPTPPEIPSAVVLVDWVDCAPMSTAPDVTIVDPGLTTAVVELGAVELPTILAPTVLVTLMTSIPAPAAT